MGALAIVVRRARTSDVPKILDLQHACYPLLSTVATWKQRHLLSHLRHFPAGQFVATQDRTIVGHSASFITRSALALAPHTFRDITKSGTFDGHDANGDTLYGAEIMVHPDYRRQGIAATFYERRFELARRLGLRYFVAGGRIPGFEDHRDRMAARAYVGEVVKGHLKDRVLSSQLRAGLRVADVLPGYLADPRSGDFATLLIWENPDLKANAPKLRPPRAARAARPRRGVPGPRARPPVRRRSGS